MNANKEVNNLCMCNEYHILVHVSVELTIIFHFNEPIENLT